MKIISSIILVLILQFSVFGQLSFQAQQSFISTLEEPLEEESNRRIGPSTIFYTGVAGHAFGNAVVSNLIIQPSELKGVIGTSLLFGGATAGIMAAATRNDYKSYTTSRAYNSGILRGALKGLMFGTDLVKTSKSESLENTIKGAGGIAFLVFNAEPIVLYQFAKKQELEAKEVHSMIRFSDIGLITSLAITSRSDKGGLFGRTRTFKDENGNTSTEFVESNALFFPSALTSYAGYVLGRQYTKKFDRTYGDLGYLFNNYFLYGAAAQIFTRRNSTATLTSEAIIASLGGLAIGHLLTQNTQLELSQTAGINAATYGAGALTFLASYLFDSGDTFRGSQYLKISAVTAIATNLLMRERAKKLNTGSNLFSSSTF